MWGAGRISNNVAGQYKRGVAIAIQVIFGNSGGAIASNVYRVRDAPRYLLGRELALSMVSHLRADQSVLDGMELMIVGVGLVLLPITVVSYWRINVWKERRMSEAEEQGTKFSPEQLRRMGDRAPDFRYML